MRIAFLVPAAVVAMAGLHAAETQVPTIDQLIELKRPGGVALSRPPDGVAFALTLAHEVQHVKLTALTDLFQLVDTSSPRRFYAPWRTDSRPAIGLLHGVHAHVGVAGFWRRQLQRPADPGDAEYAQVQFARWRAAASDAARTLIESRLLTEVGQIFIT